ncbi:MAG: biosynthetic arginine decarboxylase [Rhizobiales bacterium TMED83]|nr:arginine decarboxylase [Rhodobiaceae bacterium]RPF93015.1 MAG: biosynthetic arginine decarboxylase [Rhizobiales bacterium TMED83]
MSEAQNTVALPSHPEIERADALYGVSRWGGGFIRILENGHIGLVHPDRPDAVPTDLMHIIDSLNERGITAPVLLRVADFISYRIDQINALFAAAIEEQGYKNRYQGVFPVKVNQQAQVIDRIVDYGRPHDFGLEVGSKAELLIALAQDLGPRAALICNGVKDAEFVRLALMSQRLGFNVFIVLESPREVDLVLREADALEVRPQLGIRIKLTHKVSGNWAASSGDRSTFGMSIAQVMDVVDALRARHYLDCLKLQHSHLGSQVPNIIEIRMAAQEACRFFIEISREGAPLEFLDLGGGLGVDYTGEHRAAENSTNYTLSEYCLNIVETVRYAMDEAEMEHPVIITESGRSCVAQSSMLLFNVLEATRYDSPEPVWAHPDDHMILKNMLNIESYLNAERVHECWNDLVFYRNEMRALLKSGQVSLRETAKAERVHLYLMNRIKTLLAGVEGDNDEMELAVQQAADIYHGNFSLFQSLPDVWAIDQLHPIAPLHRLREKPTRRAVISDITCDSDGKIDRFVLGDGVAKTLPVHALNAASDYYLGVFFVGAYQETLGDLHNLFGDTNVVTVELQSDGRFELMHEQEGDTVAEVLTYVEYEPRRLVDGFKAIVERAVHDGAISARDRRAMIDAFKDSIHGYTYFEH